MLERKGLLTLLFLLAAVLILTGAAAGRAPRPSVLGELAPFLIIGLLTWYLIILIVDRNEIIAALAALLQLSGKREWSLKGFRLTAMVFAVILFFAIALLWIISPQPLRRLQGIVQQMAAPISGNASSQSSSPVTPLVYVTLIVLGAILLLSFVLFLGGLAMAIKSRQTEPEPPELEMKSDVAEVVHQAVAGLKSERGYHETILLCYRRMCIILSNAGFGIAPAQTAREFAETVATKLRIGAEAVNSLTFLFEEARYSSHEIDEDRRVKARDYLESLERVLSLKVGPGS